MAYGDAEIYPQVHVWWSLGPNYSGSPQHSVSSTLVSGQTLLHPGSYTLPRQRTSWDQVIWMEGRRKLKTWYSWPNSGQLCRAILATEHPMEGWSLWLGWDPRSASHSSSPASSSSYGRNTKGSLNTYCLSNSY